MRKGSKYYFVKVDPPVKSRFRDGPPTEFDHVILNVIGGLTLRDIGEVPLMADIVICPTYTGGPIDETVSSRIGMGGLHATYAEALADSPMEDR